MSTELNQVITHHADFLKPFAINLTSDTEAAKDLLQETLYKALANKEKYNIRTNIKTWLYTIMRNIFLNERRKTAKQNVVCNYSENDFLLCNGQEPVINIAESRLKLKEIQTAVYNLPAISRKSFLLYFDGYKYHEIANMLEVPLGTVKSRIYFARRLLKAQVSRYD
ncbi:MAG: RNA polymerase sigma factor [Ginsengibacter sp.]